MKKSSYLLFFLVYFLYSVCGYAQQWGDYTLYSLQNSTQAILMDTNQATVKTWNLTGKTGYSTYLLPGGVLLRTVARTGNSFSGGPICGEIQKVDWNGNILWDFVYSTTQYCTHHDICPMPNGNVLLISYEARTAAEATAAGSTSAIVMWPDKIVEVKQTGATTGEVVWEWKAWDHLVQSVDPAKANYYSSVSDHPELLNINYKTSKDWMHMNGIDYNPILDQIAFSCHNLNEWYIIDHSTTTAEAASHSGGNSGKGGDFLYRWGNPAAYGESGTTILNVTHDAHWIPEGVPNSGYLVGFNNGGTTSNSTIDQVNPPVSGYNYLRTEGEPFTPSTYEKRLVCNGKSSNMGNSQQLPNGNMMVCVATTGRIYEVNPAGTALWSKVLSGTVPQAFKYDTCHVKYEAPAIPSITSDAGILTSTEGATYQWYKNGVAISGANAKTYTPSETAVYLIRTTDQRGCKYSYSPGYKFTSGTSSGLASNALSSQVNLYPNPASDKVVLDYPGLAGKNFYVKVFDVSGKLVYESYRSAEISLEGNKTGVYFVHLYIEGEGSATLKLLLQAH